MRSDREKFTIYLDVKHFAPDDLNVKVTDDYVEIKGKHGERQVFIIIDMFYYLSLRQTQVSDIFPLRTFYPDQMPDPIFNTN